MGKIMPAASLDVLAYTRELETVGLPRPQAEAIAKGLMNMVAEQSDSMVTRQHFDAVMDRMDLRFEQMDQRFATIDKRLDQLETGVSSLETLKSQVNLHTWMLGLITLVLVVPQLQQWFGVT